MDDALNSKLDDLKKQYSKTKYNKATNKYLGLLRAKMAKIRKQISSKKGKKGVGFAVKKTGDATIALVGFPNAGKSSTLNLLTGVESKVADYAFTTLEVIPGMLNLKGAKIQILDTPGLIEGAHIGKGEGNKIASAIRVVDLILFIVDVTDYDKIFYLINELSSLGIDFNEKTVKVKVDEIEKGGIRIIRNGKAAPPDSSIIEVMKGVGITNANVFIFGSCTLDDILDAISEDKIRIPSIIALNKIDLDLNFKKVKDNLEAKTDMKVVTISVKTGYGIESLKDTMFGSLGLIRIFLKEKGERADFERPLIMKEGSTVFDVARRIHADLAKEVRFAYVTGSSVRFLNQRVGLNHVVKDDDVITLVS